RTDQLVGNLAIAPNHKGFRHAIDSPFNCGPAVTIDADHIKRITVTAEKTPRVVRRIFVIDADDLNALILRLQILAKREQKWRLIVAGDAPRCPYVEHAHMAFKGCGIEAGYASSTADETIKRGEGRLRRRPAN